jgi:hypothetical protein
MEEFTKEFFWDTYKTLPEELKEAIFDEKNNQIIYNICSRLGLDENQTSLVAKYTGRVLLGLLSLKDFAVTLELELNINETLSNKVAFEIDNAIFKHLRLALNKLDEQKPGHHDITELYPSPLPESPVPEQLPVKPEVPPAEEKLESTRKDIKFPTIRPLSAFITPQKVIPKEPAPTKLVTENKPIIDLSDTPARTHLDLNEILPGLEEIKKEPVSMPPEMPRPQTKPFEVKPKEEIKIEPAPSLTREAKPIQKEPSIPTYFNQAKDIEKPKGQIPDQPRAHDPYREPTI